MSYRPLPPRDGDERGAKLPRDLCGQRGAPLGLGDAAVPRPGLLCVGLTGAE